MLITFETTPLMGTVPVVSAFRIKGKRPGRGRGIGKERLQKCRTDITAVIIAGKGPDVVDQDTIGPWPLLLEHHSRWTGAPLVGGQ